MDAIQEPISLLELLEALPDPRLDRNKQHKLLDILVIAICGALCSVDNYVELELFGRAKEKWFRTFLELPNGIPSHDTIGRVFSFLDHDAFSKVFITWAQSWGTHLSAGQLAIDGKAIRASLDKSRKTSPLLMVSAWSVEHGLVVGQTHTDEGSNEISAVPKLLESLKIKGMLITLDALHCQKETAALIHEKDAQYILCVKGNQPMLRKSIAEHFYAERLEQLERSSDSFLETVDKDHGRLETRRYWLSHKLDALELLDLKLKENWPGICAVGLVERTRVHLNSDRPTSTETVLYISSVPNGGVQKFANAVRSHWTIENRLHWVLDVAFDEDRHTARTKNATQNFAHIRKFALNLIRQKKSRGGVKTKRKGCGWDHDFLLSVLRLGNPTAIS